MNIYTIGHSTYSQEKFIAILKAFDIECLVDVRAYPGSRYVPHFNQENIRLWLPQAGIEYRHMTDLGGRRRKITEAEEALVAGWTHISFRNYAAYALSSKYELALQTLMDMAKQKKVCYMCAESVPWRCHRSIISNNLRIKGWVVHHIMNETTESLHEIGKYGAKPIQEGSVLVYPAEDKQQ